MKEKETEKPNKGLKESYWRKKIEEQKTSGLIAAEYCRQNKLSAPALSYWKRKNFAQKIKKNRFMELRSINNENDFIEIFLPCGVRIKLKKLPPIDWFRGK